MTGSTDGIGKEIALELARRGFNLVLISRNPNKLNNVALQIQKMKPSCLTRVIVFDFAKESSIDGY